MAKMSLYRTISALAWPTTRHAIFLGACAALGGYAHAQAANAAPGAPINAEATEAATTSAQKLPPLPPGKATVIGGKVTNLDPVRDQFLLRIYGGGSLKVLYDARTQLFRDGVRAPMRSLKTDERASVETTLDGTDVFALKIHTISETPEGECQGQVVHATPASGLLEVRCDLTGTPVTFNVPAGTPVAHVGQNRASTQGTGFADLQDGALVSIHFKPGSHGQGTATKIQVLAVPGQSFVFAGRIASLDVRSGRMVVADGQSGPTYSLSFDPAALQSNQAIRPGSTVRVNATFDGKSYRANTITPE